MMAMKHLLLFLFTVLLLLSLVVMVDGFQVLSSSPPNRWSVQQQQQQQRSILTKVQYSTVDSSNDQAITPTQIKTLRKEASKRMARKKLPQHFFDKYDVNNDTFFKEISQSLKENELIQIRGISKDNKRHVLATTEDFIDDLSVFMQQEVTLVEIKGFAATLFCPSDTIDTNQKIQLRSSYQEGQWTRRMKAPRDHRGQIVKP